MSPQRSLARAASSLALVTSLLVLAAAPVAPSGAATTRPTSHAFSGANPQGKYLGVVASHPSRSSRAAPAARARPAVTSQVAYHGGPVQHTANVYAIFWKPNGYSLPAGYKNLVAQYFADVAHDSFSVGNPFSVDTQYFDGAKKTKRFVSYSVAFKTAAIDTRKYPTDKRVKNNCQNYTLADGTTSTKCLTAEQVENELVRVIGAKNLPTGLDNEYFVFLPQGVATCFRADSNASGCYDPLAGSGFCAYHSHIGSSTHAVLYASVPYDAVQGCDTVQSPNGNPADAAINNASHEQHEIFTDPLGTAWYDSAGNEPADKCQTVFGNPVWFTPHGYFNQVINGHGYWLQQMWSNRAKSCVPHNTYPQPTGTFSLKPAQPKHGQRVVLTPSVHDSDDSSFTYLWTFPNGKTSTAPIPKYAFAGAGKVTVTMIAFDPQGDQVKVAKTFKVS